MLLSSFSKLDWPWRRGPAAAAATASSAPAQTKGAAMNARKAAPGSSPERQALERLSAFFKERSTAHGIVGASLRVVGVDGVLLHASFGLRDRAAGEPTDEATIVALVKKAVS